MKEYKWVLFHSWEGRVFVLNDDDRKSGWSLPSIARATFEFDREEGDTHGRLYVMLEREVKDEACDESSGQG